MDFGKFHCHWSLAHSLPSLRCLEDIISTNYPSAFPVLQSYFRGAIVEGLEGVICLIDDVLVVGKDEAEHDTRLMRVLQRLETVGVTLNREKCAFRQSSVKFLGHLIGQDGVRADPEKTSTIRDMETPQSVSDLRRFLGMVNQLGNFLCKFLS